MMFVPQWKHAYGPTWPVTGIAITKRRGGKEKREMKIKCMKNGG
jgi:hypothetical protein